jgi:hypothetical protein
MQQTGGRVVLATSETMVMFCMHLRHFEIIPENFAIAEGCHVNRNLFVADLITNFDTVNSS